MAHIPTSSGRGIAIGDAADPVIVCAQKDPLHRWTVLDPARLADATITLTSTHARINDDPITALYWAPSSFDTFSASFEPSDQRFVDQEMMSLVSAIADLPNVTSNLPGIAFHVARTSAWGWLTKTLANAGIPIAPQAAQTFTHWLPHTGHAPVAASKIGFPGAAKINATSLSSCWTAFGNVFAPPETPHHDHARRVAEALRDAGVNHAQFWLDDKARLVMAILPSDAAMCPARQSAAHAYVAQTLPINAMEFMT